MASVTVAKTIGSTGTFSTPQLWEDGAPATLSTAEKSAATTFLTAAFIQGENLTFVGSGATGVFLDTDSTGAGNGTYVTYGITTGNPAASDVVTGATSSATCVLTSGTPTNTGVLWQGQLQNQEFSGTGIQLTISGGSVSAGNYKELTTFAGAAFGDNANAQTNALRYNASNGAGIRGTSNATKTINIDENRARLTKLQIAATGTDGTGVAVATNRSNIVFDKLIIEGTDTGSATTAGSLSITTGSNITVTNSLIVQRATGADHIIGTGSTGILNIYNCTVAAPDDLVTAPVSIFKSGAGGTTTGQNCSLFAGDSTKAIISGSATYAFTTCYSDISGTTGVTQATYSSEFQNVNDATRDYRLKAGAAELDTGTTDSTNAANDIVGTARPQGSAYDVGCWELIPASGSRPVKMAGNFGGFAGRSGGFAG